MSLRQMEYFLAIVEQGSFTRAAEELMVTQSALSHQVKALERELGGELLERLPRSVRLTPMGRAFLPHAETAVRGARQARRAARAVGDGASGELHLATLHATAHGTLPPVLRAWRRQRPGTRVVLHEYATVPELEEAMAQGVADLAVGPPPTGWGGPLVTLGVEEYVFLLPDDDPLLGGPAGPARGRISVAELADRSWIRCLMEPGLQGPGPAFLDRLCGEHGFAPRTAVLAHHTSTAIRLGVDGLGVVLCASSLVPPELVGRVIGADPPLRRALTAYTRVAASGVVAVFLDTLRAHTVLVPPRLEERLRVGE
ncbi:LysR family transcriptional regulator [Allostreptomyces psammosilenae]|uniref:DNA-binding transcriptional LysR family regulator n=1 Tax=Allostreptomyces psammosilenae TaxID=1892865 RepID=A0A853A018_9ACTN|nr:LysR family transcriptional regulator [Allostreptomyces psammosilenae]NYI06810.1 DNA-binding transcriptional LysR family regulator [Allostreptomyces psammosilenae]